MHTLRYSFLLLFFLLQSCNDKSQDVQNCNLNDIYNDDTIQGELNLDQLITIFKSSFEELEILFEEISFKRGNKKPNVIGCEEYHFYSPNMKNDESSEVFIGFCEDYHQIEWTFTAENKEIIPGIIEQARACGFYFTENGKDYLSTCTKNGLIVTLYHKGHSTNIGYPDTENIIMLKSAH